METIFLWSMVDQFYAIFVLFPKRNCAKSEKLVEGGIWVHISSYFITPTSSALAFCGCDSFVGVWIAIATHSKMATDFGDYFPRTGGCTAASLKFSVELANDRRRDWGLAALECAARWKMLSYQKKSKPQRKSQRQIFSYIKSSSPVSVFASVFVVVRPYLSALFAPAPLRIPQCPCLDKEFPPFSNCTSPFSGDCGSFACCQLSTTFKVFTF